MEMIQLFTEMHYANEPTSALNLGEMTKSRHLIALLKALLGAKSKHNELPNRFDTAIDRATLQT